MNLIETESAFKECVTEIQSTLGYRNPLAFGICRIDFGQLDNSKILQATYPHINWNENFGSAAIFIKNAQEQGL